MLPSRSSSSRTLGSARPDRAGTAVRLGPVAPADPHTQLLADHSLLDADDHVLNIHNSAPSRSGDTCRPGGSRRISRGSSRPQTLLRQARRQQFRRVLSHGQGEGTPRSMGDFTGADQAVCPANRDATDDSTVRRGGACAISGEVMSSEFSPARSGGSGRDHCSLALVRGASTDLLEPFQRNFHFRAGKFSTLCNEIKDTYTVIVLHSKLQYITGAHIARTACLSHPRIGRKGSHSDRSSLAAIRCTSPEDGRRLYDPDCCSRHASRRQARIDRLVAPLERTRKGSHLVAAQGAPAVLAVAVPWGGSLS